MDIKKLFWQFFKFGLIGLLNTCLDALIYQGLLDYTGYLAAYIISFVVCVLVAYVLQRKYVFVGEHRWTRVIKTYVAYGSTRALGAVGLWFCVEILVINERIAFFLLMPITIPINFFLNKIWVSKEKLKDV